MRVAKDERAVESVAAPGVGAVVWRAAWSFLVSMIIFSRVTCVWKVSEAIGRTFELRDCFERGEIISLDQRDQDRPVSDGLWDCPLDRDGHAVGRVLANGYCVASFWRCDFEDTSVLSMCIQSKQR